MSTEATTTEYVPPKVWTWDESTATASSNRPDAGARTETTLSVGKHPLQLYSMATPNGQKIGIMFEELLAAGHTGAEYDAWPIHIGKGDQFGSGFVKVNPNSKIPALADHSGDGEPIMLFESGSILLHLAEKFEAFIPSDPAKRIQTLNWLFWQVGSAPYVGGGFGHFYNYAPTKQEYPINRFAMETKRQLDVLDKHLAENQYMAGEEYTIADMAIFPWYGSLVLGQSYSGSGEFLQTDQYTHVIRWAKEIGERPAVVRGRKVNKMWGDKSDQLHERHDASDFDTKTQDKLEEGDAAE